MRIGRRTFLQKAAGAGTALVAAGLGVVDRAHGQRRPLVTIAFPETITSMDPHPAPRNSPRESMYEAVFDRFLQQDRQLRYGSHVVAAWQWTDGKMGMDLKVRPGV